MEIIAFIWSLLFQSEAQPEEWLVPISSPSPVYPGHLSRAEYVGKVRVYLELGDTGDVLGVRTVESSHPDFARAVTQATKQWRFKPWMVSDTHPPTTEVMLLVLFGGQEIEAFSPDVTVGLESVLCTYLNKEVSLSRLDYPLAPLRDVDLFAYTLESLNGAYVKAKVPDLASRKDLLQQMIRATPAVAEQCRAHPERRYIDFLPKDVRTAISWA
ncbi:TonB family protein [Pseudomonas sp. NPDC088444]|uniref:TonB family protein n=1 Tax=Pseudomonas sp. NPDC088444 TaxID=3364456 RepID=UPI00384A6E70